MAVSLALIKGYSAEADVMFSGARAFKHVEKLVSFGPRPPGSKASQSTQAYLLQNLRSYGIKVEEDDFVAETPVGHLSMKNIIGTIKGQSDDSVIIASHYDTKVFKDFKFVGANDGGSSSGALLELGRVLSKRKNARTYWIVFFDGEESVAPNSNISDIDGLYGSKHLARKLYENGQLGHIRAMILLDMIGDKDLTIYKDSNSTPWLVDLFWRSAAELGYGKYFLSQDKPMLDDHTAFLERNVPAVDLIDFQYGFSNVYWHTAEDTLDKISPRSLEIMGKVVLRGLEKIK